ncbi:aspartate/glutamate racemase family protein [Sinorhizobium meliloti]
MHLAKAPLLNPATFGLPIITEIVEGALAERVIRGDPSLEGACVTAAHRLVERGANVVAGDCSFLIRHQDAISAAVDVPVITSGLLLIPTLLRQLAPAKKLAVLTADTRHLGEELLGVQNARDRERLVIGGMEGGIYMRNTLAHPLVQTNLDQIEHEVGVCIRQLRGQHPEIVMLLFECTGFPVVSKALRRKTGLPIYDITDLCVLTLNAVVGRKP